MCINTLLLIKTKVTILNWQIKLIKEKQRPHQQVHSININTLLTFAKLNQTT